MPTNQNPLVALELDVQNLLSRGTPETISAAENLIRSFVTNAPSAGSAAGVGQLQKALIKKREEQRGKKKVSQIISRRKTAPRPLTAPSLDDPLRRFEQLGPAQPGVTPEAGQPGGPAIFSNIAGMQPPPPPAAPGPKEEFTEEEMVELGQILPANVFKRLVEGREELVAARRAPDPTALTPEAQKAFERRTGTLAANRAAPLGDRAFKFINPDTFETATPSMSENAALKKGLRVISSNNPQFVASARAARQVLKEFRSLIPKLFTDEGGPRYSNFLQIQTANVLGDPTAAQFLALRDSALPLFARASGDVANIALAEQEFQRAAIPGVGDSKRQALAKLDLKDRLLDNIVRAALGLPLKETEKGKQEASKLKSGRRIIQEQ